MSPLTTPSAHVSSDTPETVADKETILDDLLAGATPQRELPAEDVLRQTHTVHRVLARQRAEPISPTVIKQPENAALPIHIESVSTAPDRVQAALLETQAATISETILFHHQSQAIEDPDPRRYRGLRLTGAARKIQHAPSIIGVTSAVAGEGKTTTALHIALALAQNSYKNVCLVDLGLGKEVLCRRLGITPPSHGLIDVLEWNGETEPDFLPLPLLQCDSISNLYLLPAGRTPARAEKTAHSPRMPDLFAIARAWSDLIVVDLPSVASGNSLPIHDYLDGIVLVVRSGVTPKDIVATAIEKIGRNRVMGVVLNGQESPMPTWLHRRFDKREA